MATVYPQYVLMTSHDTVFLLVQYILSKKKRKKLMCFSLPFLGLSWATLGLLLGSWAFLLYFLGYSFRIRYVICVNILLLNASYAPKL